MSVSANYATPVQVNGFTCKNCTDVDYAKKHIDPAHPKSGPYGIDAKSDPTLIGKPQPASQKAPASTSAVSFGGALSALNAVQTSSSAGAPAATSATGNRLDIAA